MYCIVIMTVRRSRLTEFSAYEQGAAAVAARHGGSIMRLDSLRPELVIDVTAKVRMLRFPTDDAFRAYMKDPDLLALDPLRRRSIARMDVYAGDHANDDQGPHRVKTHAAR